MKKKARRVEGTVEKPPARKAETELQEAELERVSGGATQDNARSGTRETLSRSS